MTRLSPGTDPPKTDRGSVPGPILSCGAGSSRLSLADGKEKLSERFFHRWGKKKGVRSYQQFEGGEERHQSPPD